MVKINSLLCLFLCFQTLCFAQFGEQQIIDASVASSRSARAGDIDGDGNLDLVTNSNFGNELIWHKQLDGDGNFSEAILITAAIGNVEFFELADMDNDTDLDIVFLTNTIDKIAWLENLDGLGNFGPEQVIFADHYGYTLSVADVNGDDLPDIFTTMVFVEGGFNVVKFFWLKNEGDGSFTPNFIEDSWNELTDVIPADLDGDGDLDIITGVSPVLAPGAFLWYENTDGMGNFGAYNFIYQHDLFLEASYQIVLSNISHSDINGDDIPDLVYSVIQPETGFRIYWMRGLEATGGFSNPIEIDNPPGEYIIDLQLADIDNDNDLDLVCGLLVANDIRWYENIEGEAVFADARIVSTAINEIVSLNSGFIDADEYIDLFSVSKGDSKVAWYKNLGVLNNPEFDSYKIEVYPNPSDGVVHVRSEVPLAQLRVYNILGQEIKSLAAASSIDLSELNAGVYFLKITTADGQQLVKRILLD